jgi:hypothetical protein
VVDVHNTRARVRCGARAVDVHHPSLNTPLVYIYHTRGRACVVHKLVSRPYHVQSPHHLRTPPPRCAARRTTDQSRLGSGVARARPRAKGRASTPVSTWALRVVNYETGATTTTTTTTTTGDGRTERRRSTVDRRRRRRRRRRRVTTRDDG